MAINLLGFANVAFGNTQIDSWSIVAPTIPSGADVTAVVTLGKEGADAGSDTSSVTWNGVNFTLLNRENRAGVLDTEVWYANLGDISSVQSNVAITFSANAHGTATVSFYDNTSQKAPILEQVGNNIGSADKLFAMDSAGIAILTGHKTTATSGFEFNDTNLTTLTKYNTSLPDSGGSFSHITQYGYFEQPDIIDIPLNDQTINTAYNLVRIPENDNFDYPRIVSQGLPDNYISDGVTTPAIKLPPVRPIGGYLVAIGNSSAGPTDATPTGWTQAFKATADQDGGVNQFVWMWYKKIDGTESGDQALTNWNISFHNITIQCFTLIGVNEISDGVLDYVLGNTSEFSNDPVAVTFSKPNTKNLVLVNCGISSSQYDVTALPSGYTELLDSFQGPDGSLTGGSSSFKIGYKNVLGSLEDPGTFTHTGPNSFSVTIAFTPAYFPPVNYIIDAENIQTTADLTDAIITSGVTTIVIDPEDVVSTAEIQPDALITETVSIDAGDVVSISEITEVALIEKITIDVNDIESQSQFRPGVDTTVSGLYGKKYNGNWARNPAADDIIPDFYPPIGNPTIQAEEQTTSIDFNLAVDDTFAWMWVGFFKPDSTGTWTFEITSDDGSYLWIGENAHVGWTKTNALVNNGGLHPSTTVSNTIELIANQYYPIRVAYSENAVNEVMRVRFSGPGGTPALSTDGSGYFFGGDKILYSSVVEGYAEAVISETVNIVAGDVVSTTEIQPAAILSESVKIIDADFVVSTAQIDPDAIISETVNINADDVESQSFITSAALGEVVNINADDVESQPFTTNAVITASAAGTNIADARDVVSTAIVQDADIIFDKQFEVSDIISQPQVENAQLIETVDIIDAEGIIPPPPLVTEAELLEVVNIQAVDIEAKPQVEQATLFEVVNIQVGGISSTSFLTEGIISELIQLQANDVESQPTLTPVSLVENVQIDAGDVESITEIQAALITENVDIVANDVISDPIVTNYDLREIIPIDAEDVFALPSVVDSATINEVVVITANDVESTGTIAQATILEVVNIFADSVTTTARITEGVVLQVTPVTPIHVISTSEVQQASIIENVNINAGDVVSTPETPNTLGLTFVESDGLNGYRITISRIGLGM